MHKDVESHYFDSKSGWGKVLCTIYLFTIIRVVLIGEDLSSISLEGRSEASDCRISCHSYGASLYAFGVKADEPDSLNCRQSVTEDFFACDGCEISLLC